MYCILMLPTRAVYNHLFDGIKKSQVQRHIGLFHNSGLRPEAGCDNRCGCAGRLGRVKLLIKGPARRQKATHHYSLLLLDLLALHARFGNDTEGFRRH